MKDKLMKVLKNIKKFLIKYKWLIVMNVIIFILTVFVESLYFYNMSIGLMLLNTFIFIAGPTLIFSLKFKIKTKDIPLSVPMLYLLFLIFLGYCTQRDMFFITGGKVDTIPNFIDALFVVFVFTFVEYYITLFTNVVLLKNKKKKKKAKKEEE